MLDVQFVFDLQGLVALVATAAMVVLAVWLATRKRLYPLLLLGLLIAVASSWVLERSLMAPSRAWPVMLGAIDEAAGSERIARIRQLQQAWRFGEMKLSDWLELSGQWNVCHQLWLQRGCRMPAGPFEAQGLARESLQRLSEKSAH